MKKFKQLYESLNVIKKTTVMRYPKQVQLSKEFVEALQKEVSRYQSINESKQPILNFNEKFLKAIRFHIHELTEKRVSPAEFRRRKLKPIIRQLELIQGVRKDSPPSTKVHSTEKGRKGYDRKDKSWKKAED